MRVFLHRTRHHFAPRVHRSRVNQDLRLVLRRDARDHKFVHRIGLQWVLLGFAVEVGWWPSHKDIVLLAWNRRWRQLDFLQVRRLLIGQSFYSLRVIFFDFGGLGRFLGLAGCCHTHHHAVRGATLDFEWHDWLLDRALRWNHMVFLRA